MAHAPECSGRVYHCPLCPDRPAMTIDESWRHAEEEHPETITRKGPDPR